jgi:glycine/D-amino acid oxidase-like deaminating enzyme
MAGFVNDDSRPPKSMSFIRNAVIGETTPYVYFTRRPYDTGGDLRTLACVGGPEAPLGDGRYDGDAPVPAEVLEAIDREITPMIDCGRVAGDAYDYAWHGLMGYTANGLRAVGFEPVNPVLMYNLGCNGVGFLPSIHGGHRIARLLRGDQLAPSLFDPP